jgi:CheY-like chemotaxis protein
MSTTVLVVEDDLEINELLGEYLALENIKYLQATTGQGGIHIASTQHPDAIILDLMLPDIDGFEVARTLSTHRATFDIPIIILSCMCQECDREKGFGAGALFYMNKPFLPDDLLSTLKQAFDWRASLRARTPEGEILLGTRDQLACPRATNQLVADLYARTDLNDGMVGQIREAVETLGQWARKWNAEASQPSQLKLQYRIQSPSPGGAPAIEWKMTEDSPGMLADAFFKPPAAPRADGAALGGWGVTTMISKPPAASIAPPSQWLQLLAKTGAARFEKDSKSHTVRFTRLGSNTSPISTSASVVPVVEIDGMRYPTRLRDEAIAARRK